MSKRIRAAGCALALAVAACGTAGTSSEAPFRSEVQKYLDRYDQRYRTLYTAAQEAEWTAQTRIVKGDDTNGRRTRAAQEELAAFTGSTENIELSRAYVKRKQELSPVQTKQLEQILFKAGGNPEAAGSVVKERIAAETAQVKALYEFEFVLDQKPISTGDIDRRLAEESDLAQRLKVWECSKEVGPTLRPGLVKLRALRNDVVRALGFKDFFSYMASEYGLSTDDLSERIDEIQRALRPLFIELHTWARHELARKYGGPVPDLIPAHWLPNRWGQDWSALAQVEGYDLDAALAAKTPLWLVRQGEAFYTSLGFEPLPGEFWERSSLLPVALDAGFKKNNHASAWHVDLDHDVRALMSVTPDADYYDTAHHELGHVYYYLEYSNPKVPIVLRDGANRAFHEAFGTLMGLAAMQPRFIQAIGLPLGDRKPDPMQLLLKEALNYVVFIPWSAGTMFQWEKAIYHEGLEPEHWNERWWQLAAKYQGIEPPSERDERWCDAATKTHVNDDPAAYYDYALSFVIMFQLHDHIARQILHEDPHDSNYFGRREVGDFVRSMMRPGATVDWRALLRQKIGTDMSAKPMVDYFEPLRKWLVQQNAGRTATLKPL